jgi:hydrogenase expression/formation protein HypE
LNKGNNVGQGKFTVRDIERLCRLTGSETGNVLLPPRYGADFGVISLGKDAVMAVSTDPLYINPGMPIRDAAWFAFHVMVADIALSGLMPQYIAVDWNLPEDYPKEHIFSISETFDREAKKIGAAIVAGHTGRYEGCAPPVLGAGTVMATGHPDRLIMPVDAKPGDVLIGAGTPGLESSILLAYELEEPVRRSLGRPFLLRLRRRLRELSIIDKTSAVSGMRGITSMHDASERGLVGAIHEIAHASGVGFSVDLNGAADDSDVLSLSGLLDFDPVRSSSEGMLLLTAEERSADRILDRLRASGIRSSILGTATPPRQGVVSKNRRGRYFPLADPVSDGFVLALQAFHKRRRRRA